MADNVNQIEMAYDKTDPISIYEYAKPLIDHTLREIVGDDAVKGYNSENKGGLGQMVEELYYNYKPNSSPEPDFEEAGVELKTTGLKELKDKTLQIKERLVIDMINYNEVVSQSFEMSVFYKKFKLLLLLFYLYKKGVEQYDRLFLYVALWKIPEKDLLIIKHDYETIINKIKQGNAHILSEGDTEYLGACRKGNSNSPLRSQPFSKINAPGRAFSLKPAYMRTVLQYIETSGKKAVNNYFIPTKYKTLFSSKQLDEVNGDVEELILLRLKKWYGKSIEEIMAYYSPKANTEDYAINYKATALMISEGKFGKKGNGIIERSDEFKKSGLRLKTIPTYKTGIVKESMSYENIDYVEIYENEEWLESTTYELFTSRFLFVEFTHPNISSGSFVGRKKEQVLKRAFFWTMPTEDLKIAEEYWLDIRKNVLQNKIGLDYFWKQGWSEENKKHFHVRPKGTITSYKNAAINPNGGKADKYCYWFNKGYVQNILKDNE